MRAARLCAAIAAAVVLAVPMTPAIAAGKAGGGKPAVDIGKREYQDNCRVCHGEKGKGDGSYGELLKSKMPDITQLSKNNGGVFPFLRVYEVVDGRQQVAAHGSREMPVWGNDYLAKASPLYDEFPHDAEAFVRARVLALIEYVARLQAK